MAKKLPNSPDISYMLGICRCNSGYKSLSLRTESGELAERFVKIAVMELGSKVDTVKITRLNGMINISINNSKLKKLLDKSLMKKEKIFKYKNEYSAGYFAAMFDCNGSLDAKGISIRATDLYEKVLLERLGFHTSSKLGKTYIKNDMDFIMFIEPFSIRARLIHKSGNSGLRR